MAEIGNSSSIEINSNQPSETALPPKKKRNLPRMPDPDTEVIALSPQTLMTTNRFVCEICNKGFQRDQNLQLHRRGHNLPWKLRQRNENEVVKKRVYICPEIGCVHHHPSRALGDLTGIKKHFCRKHGEKTYKCDRCSKAFAVQGDRKAHMKTCGTRKYRCECDSLFSRRDTFMTHRAFCDVLAEESVRPDWGHFEPPPPPPAPSRGVFSPALSMKSSGEATPAAGSIFSSMSNASLIQQQQQQQCSSFVEPIDPTSLSLYTVPSATQVAYSSSFLQWGPYHPQFADHDKPPTLDFLGLGEGSSGGFSAFFSSIDMPPPPPKGKRPLM